MSIFIGKKYKQIASENLDAYFKKVGMNYMVRKLVTLENPVYCLTQNEDKFHLNIAYMVMTTDFHFKLGEEIDHKFPDGVIRKVEFTMEDNVLTQHQLGDKETFTTYTFMEKELNIEVKFGDLVSTRTCKLLE